jgi:hypothetical protein
MLHAAKTHLQVTFAIEHFEENGTEAIAILRKQ